ncbi:MAG: cupin domain-containing protein [Gemmatimonadetes bacterium]|nr:cupin domain-containing protein [Gemmatimonadota bacterium]MCC6773893.1 cupin domain-containing protein [Gemmatimonadaceae bacterium]
MAAETGREVVGEGVTRQVLGHVPDLMVVRVDFAEGACGALHHHPHRQVSYICAGTFAVTVGPDERTLAVGDCFVAAANVPHAVRALEAGTILDVFTPARAEFLGAVR